MAIFKYSAVVSTGRLMNGTIEAASRQEASELLGQMQLTVNSIEKAEPKPPKTAIGRNEFLLFNQQLASITKAGIPLERGLRELAADASSGKMRKLIEGIADELESGKSIEEAFAKRQKHFPPLYGRILKAGVETGRLSEMLTNLNRHMETGNLTRRIIFEGVSYPLIVLSIGALIATFVFVYVIPQFGPMLEEMAGGAALPEMTQLFLGMAKHVVSFWAVTGLIVAAIIMALVLLSTYSGGRRFKESLFYRVPVLGRVFRAGVLSRMSEAMAMLVDAGCDMPTCLRLSSVAAGSEKLIAESEAVAAQIEKGVNILEAGQFCRMIPRLFFYSIQLGTQRNELQDNLHSLGLMYAEQARCGQIRLQTLIFPVMIILVGGFLFLTITAMFLPMIRVVSALGSGI